MSIPVTAAEEIADRAGAGSGIVDGRLISMMIAAPTEARLCSVVASTGRIAG